ncbi:protein enabled homolog [Pollicipes pollicipes]|uniref:protein enabled homolog n=1 Tax=Pollicipes pollicipes TaxID=41117 RepID=UPI00188599C5|nr:protein enabled homolog [Pollicipes pollicipes]
MSARGVQHASTRHPNRLQNRAALARKRRCSPASGSSRKRHASEEVIGSLQSLSLSGRSPRKHQARLERWRQLEQRLEWESDPEEQESAGTSAEPRLVMSEEVQQMVSAPAPAVLPSLRVPDNSMAVVLWKPRPIPPPAAPPDNPPEPKLAASSAALEPTVEPLDVEPAEPQPPSPAYDFSPFFAASAAAPWPHQQVAGQSRFQFGTAGPQTAGWPAPQSTDGSWFQFGVGGAPGTSAGLAGSFAGSNSFSPGQEDDSMEL